MIRILGSLLALGLLGGCATPGADWAHPDVQGPAEVRRLDADRSECRASARERYPDPAGPAPVVTLNNPDAPFARGVHGESAHRGDPFTYVQERGKRVRQRRDLLVSCMRERGWRRRTGE
ncbi:hypothetical protein QWY84_16240 [Aquisalimonas lutea]|uniref:hypothetical protein n=1 Tax=Aquisalimonas lutea TaxID=1327750 RepID=UPI0025B49DC1|nr:hypothetical protein [Aquisalimonas lutea]MDN3519164.1 hypothetical protein [Aquisalimonas lutea]